MQPLKNYIGPTIRIGREILCLPCAGFLLHIYLQYNEAILSSNPPPPPPPIPPPVAVID